MMMQKPAQKQNDLRASSEVDVPVKKAIALVKEVIVIEGPAWE